MPLKNVFILILFCFSFSCASVEEFVKSSVQRPQVAFAGARIDGLSFETADLLFEVKIDNPNPVGITLAGFDYRFHINANPFLQGEQEQGVTIPANGENTFQIPVTLNFSDVYNTFSTLGDRDSTAYKIDCGVSFDLPVLGRQRVPVSKAGTLPLLKLPKVRVESIKLDNLSFSGADLNLSVSLENPNAFSFILKHMDYRLDVNDRQWLDGRATRSMKLAAKEESMLDIPISLNFVQMGQSVLQLLQGNDPVTYQLQGRLELSSSLPLLEETSLPFDRAGEIKITK